MDVEPYQLLPSHSIVPRFAVRDERRKRRTRQHAAAWADSNELQVVAPAEHPGINLSPGTCHVDLTV